MNIENQRRINATADLARKLYRDKGKRYGQAIYMATDAYFPNFCNRVVLSDVDCYNNDRKAPAFWTALGDYIAQEESK